MQEVVEPTISQLIARRVRALRAARGLSLDAMAARCEVSRSMISLIERGESSPTAVVLERIATGLNVPLASLFEATLARPEPVARREQQLVWRDPASGYVRRNVSPGAPGSPIRIVDVSFPAGAHVAYETGARETPIRQQVWVLEGDIVVTVGDATYDLRAGDCLDMALDRPTSFNNRTRRVARYAVVVATDARD
ncbi:MAG: helix-turn-helix domain-containing protein [Gaiellales bacterium]